MRHRCRKRRRLFGFLFRWWLSCDDDMAEQKKSSPFFFLSLTQTTSHFLPRPYLLGLRALELAFFVTVMVCDATTGDKLGTEFPWPAFFTSWCFVVFGLWALAGVVVTASDILRDSRLAAKVKQQQLEEESRAEEQRKISGTGEKQEEKEEDEEEWQPRRGGGSSMEASAAACSSAPATPQRGGARNNPRTATSDDLEAADAEKKKKTKNAPSPASSSVSSGSSADSRRPLAAPPKATDSNNRRQRRPSQPSQLPRPPAPQPQPMDLPHKLYSLLSSVAGPAAVFVALMYWLVLRRFIERANPTKPFDPVDAMLHGGNALFVILDVLLSRVPAASSHFQITLAYGTAYSLFIWSYERATGGRLLYGNVLSWSRPTAVGFYGFALPGSLLACFVFWCLLAAGREAIGTKLIAKREAKAGEIGRSDGKAEEEEKVEKERERRGAEEERRTKERTQRWTDENCASLPSLSTKTKANANAASLV